MMEFETLGFLVVVIISIWLIIAVRDFAAVQVFAITIILIQWVWIYHDAQKFAEYD